jgi:phosphatidylserine/phosphatidylglycerophosphate/cardiolipin synthase-like enzyme
LTFKILTAGPDWRGQWPYFTEICHLIEGATRSLHLSLYVLTEDKIFLTIKNAINRGISTELYLYDTDMNNQNILAELSYIAKKFSHFKFFMIESSKTLHTKLLIADCKKIILGSANLTQNGMFNNFEVGIYFEDANAAQGLIELLFEVRKYQINI